MSFLHCSLLSVIRIFSIVLKIQCIMSSVNRLLSLPCFLNFYSHAVVPCTSSFSRPANFCCPSIASISVFLFFLFVYVFLFFSVFLSLFFSWCGWSRPMSFLHSMSSKKPLVTPPFSDTHSFVLFSFQRTRPEGLKYCVVLFLEPCMSYIRVTDDMLDVGAEMLYRSEGSAP